MFSPRKRGKCLILQRRSKLGQPCTFAHTKTARENPGRLCFRLSASYLTLMTTTARRLSGSRTPSGVCTAGSDSPL